MVVAERSFSFQEIKLSNSIEERVRNTTDRVEHITTKMEDLNQKANCQIQSVQVGNIRTLLGLITYLWFLLTFNDI